jgi:signal transduction histidine kinase
VTRRMQALVEETLEVLADARGEPGYDIGVDELIEAVRGRIAPHAAKSGVSIQARVDAQGQMPSRTANLLKLILFNLAQNAVQATSPGKTVSLSARRSPQESTTLEFTVRDEGPGFPEHLRNSLVLPCRSTREDGSGVGLAITKQIADSIGARLELRESSANGCVFVVELPAGPGALASKPA